MSIKLELRAISKFTVENLDLDVNDGEILTLLGPSGSGKTTLLRIIAGLTKPTNGSVKIDDITVVSDTIFVHPEDRKIGMVFQNFGLFPHMTVEANVGFGLSKMKKNLRKIEVDQVLSKVGLCGLEKRYPHQLSGGQQQRVAVARALVTKPAILLFDEPFSSLDGNLRDCLRQELRQTLKKNKLTAIFVTHDKQDALSLSDRIAVLNNGIIEQINTPEAIYTRPVSEFIASYFGQTNLLKATTGSKGYESDIGFIDHQHDEQEGIDGMLSIRPQWCAIAEEDHLFKGEVIGVTYYGDYQEVRLRLDNGQLFHIHIQRHEKIEIGTKLGVTIDTPDLTLIKK